MTLENKIKDALALIGVDIKTLMDNSVTLEGSIGVSSGTTLGLQQELLANAGQVALTPLVVGPTSNGKVQGSSLGDGNVIRAYLTGDDFVNGNVFFTQFANLGNNFCFTGLQFGSIIVATKGFFGITEIEGESTVAAYNAVMPLLPYGLSFDKTSLYAFRNSTGSNADRGVVYLGNGPIETEVSLLDGSGNVVRGQDSIKMGAWGSTFLDADGNQEYLVDGVANRKMVGCIVSRAGGVALNGVDRTQASLDSSFTGRMWDARIIPPMASDLIVQSRSGWCYAALPNTAVRATSFDGTVVNFTVSPGAPVQISSVLSNLQHQNPAGFWRLQATGLIGVISGADGQGGDAWAGFATNTMSQVLGQPFYLTGSGNNDEVGLTFFGPYEGQIEIWEEDEATQVVSYRSTVTMTRGASASYPAPAAAAFSNDGSIANNHLMGGNLKPGFVRGNVPFGMIAQTQGGVLLNMNSQNGATVDGIYSQEDETAIYGFTPKIEAAEIRLDAGRIPRRRNIDQNGIETWVEV